MCYVVSNCMESMNQGATPYNVKTVELQGVILRLGLCFTPETIMWRDVDLVVGPKIASDFGLSKRESRITIPWGEDPKKALLGTTLKHQHLIWSSV